MHMDTTAWKSPKNSRVDKMFMAFSAMIMMLIYVFIYGPIHLGTSRGGRLVGTFIFGLLVFSGVLLLQTVPAIAVTMLGYSVFGSIAVLAGIPFN